MTQTINWTAIDTFNDLVHVPTQVYEPFYVVMIYLIAAVVFGVTIFQGLEVALVFTGIVGIFISLPLQFIDPPVIGWWVTGTFAGMVLFVYLYHEFSNRNK